MKSRHASARVQMNNGCTTRFFGHRCQAEAFSALTRNSCRFSIINAAKWQEAVAMGREASTSARWLQKKKRTTSHAVNRFVYFHNFSQHLGKLRHRNIWGKHFPPGMLLSSTEKKRIQQKFDVSYEPDVKSYNDSSVLPLRRCEGTTDKHRKQTSDAKKFLARTADRKTRNNCYIMLKLSADEARWHCALRTTRKPQIMYEVFSDVCNIRNIAKTSTRRIRRTTTLCVEARIEIYFRVVKMIFTKIMVTCFCTLQLNMFLKISTGAIVLWPIAWLRACLC